MANDGVKISQGRRNFMNSSLIFFVVVCALIVGFHLYNSTIKSNNTSLNQKISSSKNTIDTLNKESSIVLYTLLKENRDYLNKYAQISQITEFINDLNALGDKFDIKFTGFNYSEGKIISQATVQKKLSTEAGDIVADFIRDFRGNINKNRFDLAFINLFSGQDEIKFQVELTVKDKPIEDSDISDEIQDMGDIDLGGDN